LAEEVGVGIRASLQISRGPKGIEEKKLYMAQHNGAERVYITLRIAQIEKKRKEKQAWMENVKRKENVKKEKRTGHVMSSFCSAVQCSAKKSRAEHNK
jgi:hypothetical protein